VFDLIIPGQPEPLNGIRSHTRVDAPIKNENDGIVTGLLRRENENLSRQYPESAVCRRTPPIPCFNCHGLAFMARRTCIGSAEVRQVLREDGYTEVPRKDVRPGDTILWIQSNGDIEHSGIVLSTGSDCVPFAPAPEASLLILSKWGQGPEVIHREFMCPYSSKTVFMRVTDGLTER
jgi:hypothetical protein